MKFSFNDDDVFLIEEDEIVKSSQGIKACECVVLLNSNVALIEAKSSSPKIDNGEKFKEFIDDIRQKFSDTLQLFYDIKTGRKGTEAFQRLPVNLQTTRISAESYKIYLVIHGHRIEWLGGLLDALKNALRDEVRKWNLRDSNIKVYNEETALENRLIVGYVPKDDISPFRLPDGNPDKVKLQEWFDHHH